MRKVLSFALLLCFSGTCALIYQSVWFREFRLIFGASTMASSAVLAIFMAGLGAGSVWLGSRADRSARPIGFYARLEFGITVAAAISPFLLDLVRTAFVYMGGGFAMGFGLGTVVRLVLSCFVLFAPTFLMGGTLPSLARAVETSTDVNRKHLALLYGFNTLGAVAGIVLSNFYLFEQLGNRLTLWSACLVNGLVVIAARQLNRSCGVDSVQEQSVPVSGEPINTSTSVVPVWLIVIVAGGVGFAFMFMELVWYRMLGPILGGTTFTFGIILAVALAGIGAGSLLYPVITSRIRPSLALLAFTCSAEALLIAVPFALGDKIAELAWLLRSFDVFGFHGQVASWALICMIVVFPPALLSGVQFPVLIALLGEGREGVGKDTGTIYLSNTIGSILGSLAGGFGLLPLLSATGAWRAVVILLALITFVLASRQRVRSFLIPVCLSIFGLFLLFAQGPTAVWRHAGIGAGRIGVFPDTVNSRRAIENNFREMLLWQSDGIESGVALMRSDGVAFVVNGKVDGNIYNDAGTQVMSCILGSLLVKHAESFCVIGLGTGSTAGWVASLPETKLVDVIELEPGIRRVAEDCARANKNALANPKVNLIIGDGREWLLTTDRKYDVVFSEPSNPYRAGIASLFTQQFYQAARGKLNQNGVFAQWLQAYEVDAEAVCSVYATLLSVFPHVETWQTQGGDLVLFASEYPMQHNLEEMKQKISQPAWREALCAAWKTDSIEGVLAHYVGGDRLAQAAARGAGKTINTDDLTNLEFAFGRSMGKKRAGRTAQLRELSAQTGDSRLALAGGSVDWDKVDELAAAAFPTALGTQMQARAIKHIQFGNSIETLDYPRAVDIWSKDRWDTGDLREKVFLGMAFAQTNHADAAKIIAEIQKFSPSQALALQALLAQQQGKKGQAAEQVIGAFRLFRDDPWAVPELMEETLNLALALAKTDRNLAIQLFDELAEPFAVYRKSDSQKLARVRIASATEGSDVNPRCLEALKQYEPNPVWDASFLMSRAACYQKLAPELAPEALRDLNAIRNYLDIPVEQLSRIRSSDSSRRPEPASSP